MSSNTRQPGAVSLSDSIGFYFEISLYLLVVAGFATLVGTGGLDLPTVSIVGVALAFRGYQIARGHRSTIPESWATGLTLGYFLFFAADYFLLSRAFLPATVHLALFAVVVRMFSLRRERDHVMLAILAFLMVLASAVLTVDSVFLFCFAIFLLITVSTFVLMEMRTSGRAASMQARNTNDPNQPRRLGWSVLRMAPALMLMILIAGVAVFFLLPRMSAGYLGAYSYGTDFSSGFSDRVQLGQIGQIQQSNAVVMHIQIDGDPGGAYSLHWRGVALADFDGHTWSNPREQYVLQRQPDNRFIVPPFGNYIPPNSPIEHPPAHLIHYRVLMEPIGTNVFFLAPWARTMSGDYRMLTVDAGAAVYSLDNQHAIGVYDADSDISAPSPAQLRTAGVIYPPQVTGSYLRLPVVDPRIFALAAQVAGNGLNYDKAAAIESYLKTHFGYTLQLPKTIAKDPIAQFLFERKQGHCEYFASSMAVMLRTLGIPARVVNGFRSDEFNDVTGNYVVRGKDAHSWVEAYFPGYGWQTFDPTPPGGSGTPQGWARAMLYIDAASSFWREWVVSYDASHQYVLGRTAITSTRTAWEHARDWARAHYEAMLRWAERSQKRMEHSPGSWLWLGLAAVLALVLLANMGRIARAIYEIRLGRHPERSPELAATMWYGRMARLMKRRGVGKPAGETPVEFLQRIEEPVLRERVARFTEAYESARFGNSPGDAQRLPELCEEVESVLRK